MIQKWNLFWYESIVPNMFRNLIYIIKFVEFLLINICHFLSWYIHWTIFQTYKIIFFLQLNPFVQLKLEKNVYIKYIINITLSRTTSYHNWPIAQFVPLKPSGQLHKLHLIRSIVLTRLRCTVTGIYMYSENRKMHLLLRYRSICW